MIMDNSIKGKPTIRNSLNFIGVPFLSAMPATITLAEAPIREPLPPRQAPKASDHQIDSMGIWESWPTSCNNGIMVATKGMLSTKAEASADNHKTRMPVKATLSPVICSDILAIRLITPFTCRPPTSNKKT